MLHLFEFLALRLLDEPCHEEDAENGAERVDGVGGADSDTVFAGKHRESPGDHEVRKPLGKSANGNRDGTDAVVEHFAEHHPHDRSPRCGEEGNVEVRCNQGDDGGMSREASAFARTHEAERKRAQGDCHADTTNQQERFSANLVNEHNCDHGHYQVHSARNHAREESVAFAEADTLPKHGAIIEDDVNTHKLLQNGEAETCPQNRRNLFLAVDNFEHIGKFGRFLVLEGELNRFDFFVDAFGIDHGEYLLGLVKIALADKVTRRFGKPPGGITVNYGRNDFNPEHHLPGLDVAEHGSVGRTRDAHDQVV